MNKEEAKAKIIEEYGENPETFEFVSFCQTNWVALTNSEESEMHAEQEFDDAVLELKNEFDISYDDLCENW